MGLYTKLDLYGFADFYHRFAMSGLTMEELLVNYERYRDKPRDIKEPIQILGTVKEEIIVPKPPALRMYQMLNVACTIRGVEKKDVNSKSHKRIYNDVRQWVCYAALRYGWVHADIARILKWDRTLIYHREKKCLELASYPGEYRNSLNELLHRFGIDPITD